MEKVKVFVSAEEGWREVPKSIAKKPYRIEIRTVDCGGLDMNLYALVRTCDEKVIYGNSDLKAVVIHCWYEGINPDQVHFV